MSLQLGSFSVDYHNNDNNKFGDNSINTDNSSDNDDNRNNSDNNDVIVYNQGNKLSILEIFLLKLTKQSS